MAFNAASRTSPMFFASFRPAFQYSSTTAGMSSVKAFLPINLRKSKSASANTPSLIESALALSSAFVMMSKNDAHLLSETMHTCSIVLHARSSLAESLCANTSFGPRKSA